MSYYEAFKEGYKAAHDGFYPGANPYPKGSGDYDAWLEGHAKATREDRQLWEDEYRDRTFS